MELTRRGFLRLFSGAAIAAALPIPPAACFEVAAQPEIVAAELPMGLWGLQYWQVASSAGSYLGLERSAFP